MDDVVREVGGRVNRDRRCSFTAKSSLSGSVCSRNLRLIHCGEFSDFFKLNRMGVAPAGHDGREMGGREFHPRHAFARKTPPRALIRETIG